MELWTASLDPPRTPGPSSELGLRVQIQDMLGQALLVASDDFNGMTLILFGIVAPFRNGV